MPGRIKKIVVAGDVTIDWLMWRIDAEAPNRKKGSECPNWKLFMGTEMAPREGGALLLAQLVRAATNLPVAAPSLDNLSNIPPAEVLHSNVLLAKFPHTQKEANRKADKEKQVFRVKEYLGYCGPGKDKERLRVIGNDADADLVILDDAGNSFRYLNRELWPLAITTEGKTPLVMLKMSRPLQQNPLFDDLLRNHGDRLVVVLSADDLRAEGVNISRRLSWERTARDFAWHLANHRTLKPLAKCRHLVVRFGLDGAAHYTWDGEGAKTVLYYDPARVEDDFKEEECPGKMTGLTMAFVAGLTAHLVKDGLAGVGEGVRQGILCSRRFLCRGYPTDPTDHEGDRYPKYPGAEIFNPPDPDQTVIADIDIPSGEGLDCPDPDFWTILQALTRKHLADLAFNTVKEGRGQEMEKAPVARFGKLKTLDRAEMESFRSIKNILTEYLKGSEHCPLSIAVFGPPGSGKSFGATQVARSIKAAAIAKEPLEFNLSQWQSPHDLVKALHQVRDVTLGGQVPLIFFDEFDADFQVPLGWLKYFLDPMQSGKFKEGEITHPIGKAVFIFAGGISKTLREFSREDVKEELKKEEIKEKPDETRQEDWQKRLLDFKNAKGPDFVSRLRGYVDIMGVNPHHDNDKLCLIRRAVLLRGLLEREATHLITDSGLLQIDPGLLWALLMAPRYEHGVRSMEAIIKMSQLSERRCFEQAALPPPAQLDLHIDASFFCRLLDWEVLFGRKREQLAQAIHEKYRKEQQGKKPPDDPAMQPWEEALREDLKDSNRLQADQIPEKLKVVGCVLLSVVGQTPAKFAFSPEEVELLAEMEHERWMAEKIADGWTFAPPPRYDVKKTHPCLRPWDQLTEASKDIDRWTVRDIPEFLAGAGFEIHRVG